MVEKNSYCYTAGCTLMSISSTEKKKKKITNRFSVERGEKKKKLRCLTSFEKDWYYSIFC